MDPGDRSRHTLRVDTTHTSHTEPPVKFLLSSFSFFSATEIFYKIEMYLISYPLVLNFSAVRIDYKHCLAFLFFFKFNKCAWSFRISCMIDNL